MSYMAAIRQAHLLRGLQAQALSETMVKAALKGLKNKESLKSHDDLATFGKSKGQVEEPEEGRGSSGPYSPSSSLGAFRGQSSWQRRKFVMTQ